MANRQNNTLARATRKRLIEAAGNVFADNGYEKATVREITLLARSSLAAVNYHFGSKLDLYKAVLDEVVIALKLTFPPEGVLTGKPETQLRKFVDYYLRSIFVKDHRGWLRRLWLRESTCATSDIMPTILQIKVHHAGTLAGILQAISKKPRTKMQLVLMVEGIFGQCIHFWSTKTITDQMYPGVLDFGGSTETLIETLVDHISQVTLCAMSSSRRPRRRRKKLK